MVGAHKQPSWGWHRLTDSWAQEIVARAGIRRGELVLDVGAGHGAITNALVERGAYVIAVELHAERAELLRRRFHNNTVKVVRADADDLRLPTRPFRVVSNPPFALTTPLLRRLLVPNNRLLSAHLVLQRESARRWARGDVRGAERWWRAFDLAVVHALPRSAFIPKPSVDTSLLQIVRRR